MIAKSLAHSRRLSLVTRLLSVLLIFGATPAVVMADVSLRILHTNDFHARFEPVNKYDSDCSAEDDEAGQCFGGSARLATAIKQARSEVAHSVLLDGGDQFQGSLFFTHYQGTVTAELMNTLGYDAMTVGNHEFDKGPGVLRQFMDAINFPIVMSNADISREPVLAERLPPWTLLNRGDVRIGVIGLTPQDTDETASPGKHIVFQDPVTATRAAVQALQAQGINIIIVLSHSGFGVDQRVARAVSDIDVIVGGHSNTLLANDVDHSSGPYPVMINNTAIVQAYAYGKYLGVLDLQFDDKGGILSASGQPRLLDASVEEDASIKQRLQVLAKPLQKIRHTVVASSFDVINGDRDDCRVRECTMGNLVADAMLDRVKSQRISIAIQNAGGLRASIDKGDVTMGEVLTVLPFQNTLATFELTGKQVIEALENGVSEVESATGRFPQVAGLRFTWDSGVAPNQGRVTAVMTRENDSDNWTPIDPDANYGVVSNNFMRTGGDGYAVFADHARNVYDYGPGLETVVADYLAARSPYQPYTDGRITPK